MIVSEGQYGDGVPEGVRQVDLRANVLYQTGHWTMLLDCSNTFNSIKRPDIFREVDQVVPALPVIVVYS